MDWQILATTGLVVTLTAALLAIPIHLFGLWDRWKRWRQALPDPGVDQAPLKARIRLATGPGSGLTRKKRGNSGSITIKFRNEGLHPAFDFRPTLTSGDWEAIGHATGIAIPSHQERFFQFPYLRFPVEEGHKFTLTAPYRDGTGDHIYTLRFHHTGRDYPKWRAEIESEG